MTSFITWRAGDVEKAIFNLLKQMLPNTKLQDFEKKPNSEIREIKPPRDGIAYVGEYLMEMAMTGIPGMVRSSDKIKIEQYWNKDGNCIGFMFQGKKYIFDKEKLPERDRELGGQMTVNDSWAERVVSYLTGFLPKRKLETFRKNYSKEDVIEHNPPFNGIAYSCAYRCHTMVTKPISNGRGEAKSSYADIVQYWDKDGNCIGFMFQGQKYMFDKEKLPEQGQEKNTQSQDNKVNVSLDSDLVRAMTRAVGENNNMEIYGTEVLAIEPAIDGVAFAQKARGVAALARQGSSVVEKSVWFDAVRLYDAKGAFLGMQVTDDKLFNEYDVSNSGLLKADAKTMEMIKNANKKLEAVRDANGSIIGLDLTALSKKQQFERGQVLLTTTKIPENSDMARFVAEHPGVKVTHRVTTAGKLVYSVVDKWPIGGEIVDFDQDGKEIRRIGIKSMENQRD